MATARRCANWDECGSEGPTLLCSGCKKVSYCSKKCQTELWTNHIFDCGSVPISTAHYLAQAIRRDLIPTDQQTRIDWGFERAPEFQSNLLGLYNGLFMIDNDLKPRILNKWRLDGILVDKIKELFNRVPESSRGGYYPWFLKNQWVLDSRHPRPQENTNEGLVKRMRERLEEFLGEDLRKIEENLTPRRQKCLELYALLLSKFHPPPGVDMWISFGFCVAKNGYDELEIGRAYQALINKCPFEEFASAYEVGELFGVMEKYGVAISIRHFSTILSQVDWNQSVWDLKESLMSENPLVNSVIVDYGFMNCKTAEDHAALMDVYKRLLEKDTFDEMEMHGACIKGELLEYVKKHLPLRGQERKRMARLMKNPYPLADI